MEKAPKMDMVVPFLLKPTGKDYLWGGTRLRDDFYKDIELDPLAETWECSTHSDGPSYVASGEMEGLTLKEVLKQNPAYMGKHKRQDGEIPILIKFIDAKKDLSVQVHPSDEYADKNEGGQLGKTEMWYILDARKNARLVYGFNVDVTEKQIRKSIENGRIEKLLQYVEVSDDDVFFIESGTVHAIGEGLLIAEIQENSNLTYRLYDYNRRDRNGNLRRLDIDKALDVADMRGASHPRQPMRTLKYSPGMASELLCRCKYFQTERLIVNTEHCRQLPLVESVPDTFFVLLCVKGCGTLFLGKEESITFIAGDCIFVPAGCEGEIKIHGKATFLKVSC